MSEQELAAPSEAADEAVISEATETSEATENTEGQVDDQPAEAKAEEEKTKSQARRERREAAERRAREEAAESARKLAESEARLARIRAAAKAVAPPKESDFTDPLDYVAASAAYRQAQVIAQMQESEVGGEVDALKKAQELAAQMRQKERLAEFAETIPEARAKYADFDAALEVAKRSDIVSPALAEMVLDSERPHDLAYHLGKNPELARALSQMNPVQAARKLGAIEASLSAPRAKTQSSAPEPVNPVKGGASPARNPDKMSVSEWAAARAKGWIPQ